MKRATLQSKTVQQLVAEFLAIALAQYEAIEMDEHAKFNRLYAKMEDVRQELKVRAGDQRKALLPLLQHANPQVRLKSAITTLALAPEAARAALQLISDRHEYPQAADARGMLRALNDGSYVPT